MTAQTWNSAGYAKNARFVRGRRRERCAQKGGLLRKWVATIALDYGARLAAAGFEVRYIALIPRPTPLPGDLVGWLSTFSGSFTAVLPQAAREEYLECVRERIRPYLCDAHGNWTADYVRLRFAAHLGLGCQRSGFT
jgi:hypothetical protein